MPDVILVRPLSKKFNLHKVPPWGILYTAAPLVSEGYSVKIIDQVTEPRWKEVLLKELKKEPVCIGISSITGEQIKHGLDFSEIVRANSDIPIVWGGVHPSLTPEQTVEDPLVDVVVKGEGEETFLELLQALEKNKSLEGIKGVSYKENGKIVSNPDRELIDLNSIPDIPYHLIDVERYITPKDYASRTFEICTSRGCPHRCAFCYNEHFVRSTWRTLDVDKIIENAQFIVDKFKVDGIDWREDNFFVNKKRVGEICKKLIEEKIDVNWHADCRIDYFAKYDAGFVDILKRSGCSRLTFGVESGSQRILDYIRKGITVYQIASVDKKLEKSNMDRDYHFMLGFPEETRQDAIFTIKLISKLIKNNSKTVIIGPSLFTPYPGTRLYHESVGLGFKPPTSLRGWVGFDWQTINLPWLSTEYSDWIQDIAFMGKYSCGSNFFLEKWFKFRLNLLSALSLKGPLPEKWLVKTFKMLRWYLR